MIQHFAAATRYHEQPAAVALIEIELPRYRAASTAKKMMWLGQVLPAAKKRAKTSTREICTALWKTTRLQGCACHHCKEHLYHKEVLKDHRQPYHPIRGLTPGGNEAWHVAEAAVTRIIFMSEPNSLARAASLSKWTRWDSDYSCEDLGKRFKPRVHESVNDEALAEVVDIFNELFFAGQLPSSRVKIYWRSLGMSTLGFTDTSSSGKCKSRIFVNKDFDSRPFTRGLVLAVVLHEMIHAYLGLYTCYPWSKPACAKGICGKLYQANVGDSGHGRAFHLIAKTIEERMNSFLGFTVPLGRYDGMISELREGGPRPCMRDAKRLYAWTLRTPDFWRSRDDDDVLRAKSGPKKRSYLWIPNKSLCRSQRRYSC
ncbi:hypothetical protein DOTSEDRAFT_70487 [Dothistroma septosporum NZE10]|uniref:C2H2-type domain-containing protein n=1 Tax=Dothistroma septosporum (strain NZE10 / CBS 128990) TaxID=675120 RepID=N1PVR4_DOTSN|nr:hypothetical protein DOTSEDRAFT_70487 [Dothistroma septosporum NZE10]